MARKPTTHILVEPYYEYLNFINTHATDKKEQNSKNIVVHRHHIIPKHLGGSDKRTNLVYLTVEDHCRAHLLFSKCFEEKTYEHWANVRAANMLDKRSIRNLDELKQYYESSRGILNPFFGKTHSEETLKQIQATKEKNGTTKRGLSYDEIYGDAAKIEKEKRRKATKEYWLNASPEDKEKRIEKQRESAKKRKSTSGSKNGFAESIEVNGIVYGSIREACDALNVSAYILKKHYNIIRLGKTNKLK